MYKHSVGWGLHPAAPGPPSLVGLGPAHPQSILEQVPPHHSFLHIDVLVSPGDEDQFEHKHREVVSIRSLTRRTRVPGGLSGERCLGMGTRSAVPASDGACSGAQGGFW